MIGAGAYFFKPHFFPLVNREGLTESFRDVFMYEDKPRI